uniref:ABC transporter ATP-binding protein n=1 Tax=Thermofilum pendens TaxID=2269 RepID=A0A7J3X7E3_THEPE
MKPLLEVKNLRAYYRTFFGVVRAVDGVSFELYRGEILGIIGESGCGKSSLVQSIVMPKPPLRVVEGSVLLHENGRVVDLTRLDSRTRRSFLGTRISLVPQYVMDALPTVRRVRDVLRDIAREKKLDYEELKKLFVRRLRGVNLDESVLERYPLELSGGMRQRTILALATLFNPDILIADEPASALDLVSQRQVLELIRQLRDEKIVGSVIYITHDIASVRQIADRVLVMYAGKILESGSVEDIVNEPLHPYTKVLIKSVPPLGVSYTERRLEGLKGAPPSLLSPPPGCRFAPRCPYAFARCMKEETPLVETKEGRVVSCWLYLER